MGRKFVPLAALLLTTACSTPPESRTPESREDFNLAVPLFLQESSERVFKDVQVEEITPLLSPDSLHFPGSTHLTEHGVFVTEYSDAHIWLFDFEGNLVQTFGAGKGDGPGEMQNPLDMVVFAETLAVLDAYSFDVHRFLLDGTFLDSQSMTRQGLSMASTRSTTLVLMTNPEQPLVRYPFVEGDSSVVLFEGLGGMDIFSTVGNLTSDDDHIVFIHPFRPFFAVMSDNGDVMYARATVDDGSVDDPDLTAPGGGPVRFPPPLNRRSSAFEGRLYMENGPTRTDSSFVVDVYDLEDQGAYLYSLRMPFSGRSISMRGNLMTARTGPVTASLFRFEVVE
ncbi:MAG: hypothetical protein RIE53_09405 [Rhodothermales bacterium]